MARKINSIEEVNDTKETWKLAVRITDLWCVQKSQIAGSIEMIFMDEKGDKIHAAVRNYDLDRWKNRLKEGSTYIVQNFEVKSNNGQYKISQHPYKLVFMKGTIVKEHDLPQIPESNTLNCTLWEEYAAQLWRFLEKHESGPVVILLTLAKIKDSQGKYPISIQNSMYSSKLLINENIVEIQQYRNSLDSNNFYDSFSQRITQLSLGSQASSQDKFFQNAQVKSIVEINSLMQECSCITVGKIDKVFARNGWSYASCSKCNKKGDPKVVPYICVSCGKNISETILRFRIEVKVSDSKESSTFVLWNRECIQLLKHTAVELKKQLMDEGEMDPMAFPKAIDGILGKTLAFRVKVQPAYKCCSVSQVSEDLQIIEHIKRSIGHDEQSFSATADCDPNLRRSLTPAKRLIPDMQLDDFASQDQTSGQAPFTKLTKHIKIEATMEF